MPENPLSRRSFLGASGAAALTAFVGATAAHPGHHESNGEESDGSDDGDSSVRSDRESFTIMDGTEFETTGYAISGARAGPTAMVVGGIHGNEVAGYGAAGEIARWTLDAGTLVVLPEANRPAIEDGTRVDGGEDLNRQFPTGEEPESELARAVWDVVLRFEPDALIDLHESTGLAGSDEAGLQLERGVGQVIFHSADEEATTHAEQVAAYMNAEHVPESMSAYDFEVGNFSADDVEPSGLLAHKFSRDVGESAFLVETTSTDVDLETRIEWQTAIVEQLLLKQRIC